MPRGWRMLETARRAPGSRGRLCEGRGSHSGNREEGPTAQCAHLPACILLAGPSLLCARFSSSVKRDDPTSLEGFWEFGEQPP